MNRYTTVKELINSGKYGEFADAFWTYITDDHLNSPLDNYGFEACVYYFPGKEGSNKIKYHSQ